MGEDGATAELARDASGWFVVNTQPHREHVAVEHLTRQSFRAYNPMISRVVRHARRESEVRRPLFPGYLFVARDAASQRWRRMLSTVGVRTVVRFGETPAVIDGAFVKALRAREQNGVIVKPTSPYKVGQSVEIVRGSLEGLVARIVAVGERDRITILLSLLGRTAPLTVDAASVREVTPRSGR